MNNNEPLKSKKNPCFLWFLLITILLFTVHCSQKSIPQKKQIILISIDTLRGDHLSSLDYFRDTTPHLAQLVKDSLYYPNAYTNGCWTFPSHISLLTGTLPSRHGINADWKTVQIKKKYPEFNPSLKVISEILLSNQIETFKYAQLPDELGFARGYKTNYRIDPFSSKSEFDKLLKDIEDNKGKDFFFFIHTWIVHAPYSNSHYLPEEKAGSDVREAINNFNKLKVKQKSPTNAFREFLKRKKLFNADDCRALYDSGIYRMDQTIGRLIDKTKQLGIYNDLLIIVVSDHGEHFNEHFKRQFYNFHGRDFFEEFIKVPLIIKYPAGTEKPQTRNHPVSLIDVFPTILDCYNIPLPAFVQGESLLTPYSKRKNKYIISEAISMKRIEKKMVRVGDLKYILTMDMPSQNGRVNWNAVTNRRLYNLKDDPQEKINLFNNKKFKQVCIDLEKLLYKVITDSSKNYISNKETNVDEETLKQLETLGYLQ